MFIIKLSISACFGNHYAHHQASFFDNLSSIHIRKLPSNLIHNSNKCTSIRMHFHVLGSCDRAS